ncbi:hypothetical protein B0H34DRAFT_720086 [Crassisporium funariophilum]|nr:hypothetical protein B0H34DRAFT_720086 [Crassisporium funariophilum]
MKKLFGHKPKPAKPNSGSRDFSEEIPKNNIPTPLYQKLATHGSHIQGPLNHSQSRKLSTDEDRWEVVPPQPDPVHLPNPHPPPMMNAPSRTSSFGSLPPGASPPLASPGPPRSASPMSAVTNMSTSNKLVRTHDRDREAYLQSNTRKKSHPTAPVALGILRALDPPRSDPTIFPTRSQSEERYAVSESGHRDRDRDNVERREKRGFWGNKDREREKEKEREKERERERERERELYVQKEREMREREREKERDRDRDGGKLVDREAQRGREIRSRDDEGTAELTRMIGYLTATASEDWVLVLEVCERASANETNAKEAVRALRREFKYGEPPAQLSAARLWAIMLRNSSDMFISQSTSRKFLDTLEDLLSSSRTSPVVRERLLEVVAAAAYASGNKKDSRHDREGFKGLWKRVKPFDKPEEGVPFDTDDAMFHPPVSGRLSGFEIPIVSYQEPSPLPIDPIPQTPPPHGIKKRKSPTRNRIIPPDEDMRRLFQECKIGHGNASLLSQALALSKPEDLKKKEIIKEFYIKCRSSQELIYAQIPWASAGAERSRALKDKEGHVRKRTMSNDLNNIMRDAHDVPVEQTLEEMLLAALLGANGELLEALKQYDDMERVAIERKAEDRSRREIRMERRNRDNLSAEPSAGGGSSSRSPSPSSRSHSPQHPVLAHPRPHHLPLSESDLDPNLISQNLAPPPAAPHGPRSPAQASIHSRTPSPGTPQLGPQVNGFDLHDNFHMHSLNGQDDDDHHRSNKPSAKALGKRKVIEPDNQPALVEDTDDMYFEQGHPFALGDAPNPDIEDDSDGRWRHPPVQFVYDAVAERTRQRLEGGQEQTVNGVH